MEFNLADNKAEYRVLPANPPLQGLQGNFLMPQTDMEEVE